MPSFFLQPQYTLIPIALLIAIVPPVNRVLAQQPPPSGNAVQSVTLKEQVREPGALSINDLQKRTRDNSDEEAISARWELTKRTSIDGAIQRDQLFSFIGFIEGRLHIHVSNTWQKSLLLHSLDLPAGEANALAVELGSLSQVARASAESRITLSKGSIKVTSRELPAKSFAIEASDSEAHSLSQARFAFVETDDELFVADCLKNGIDSFRLHSLSLKTGKPNWSVDVRGTNDLPFGSPIELLEIVANDECVIVYGCGSAVFIETFERKSGRALVRLDVTKDHRLTK